MAIPWPFEFNIRFLIVFSLLYINVSHGDSTKENPLTAKASLIRYWNRHVSNNLPKPDFLLSKASPLTPIDMAIFTNLASQSALSAHLSTFCSAANLFCGFNTNQQGNDHRRPQPNHHRHQEDYADFASYSGKQFTTYGSDVLGGTDSFKNYSTGVNMPTNSFTRYSPSATGHNEEFIGYASNANVGTDTFTNYAHGATGGSGDFTGYERDVNVPNLKFASYDSEGNNHELSFAAYTEDTNSGSQAFFSYGKNGNGAPVDFSNYATTSNIVGSTFTGYSELGNGANDSFKGYSTGANNPTNNFKAYGVGGNSGLDTFVGYRDGANVGDDTFQFYGRNSNSARARFDNYGKSFNQGTDTFKEYGGGATNRDIEFKAYGANNTFKGYGDGKGIEFSRYIGQRSSAAPRPKWLEEGKFFRESMLKQGTVIKMPDITDRMPRRSFLPRSISSKLPFSTSKVGRLKGLFHAHHDLALGNAIDKALAECERPASRGETKRCVGSIEDMIDLAVSMLGHNVVVRTTENVNGSDQRVVLGTVKGINGGKVTRSVSCHQSLFPYLLYYCHSVPRVRVYEADIHNIETKEKVNRGVAVCHLDTSDWSPGHGAFVALGSGPGLIEVCHWIYENDMTWTTAD